MPEEDPSDPSSAGWVCPKCGAISGSAYYQCWICREARPSEPSWSAMPKYGDQPSPWTAGGIIRGLIILGIIIALIIAMIAAFWLYQFVQSPFI